LSCLACDVLAGRIEPPGGTIYEDEFWVVEAAEAADAIRQAWS
jgi:hypothetical protein